MSNFLFNIKLFSVFLVAALSASVFAGPAADTLDASKVTDPALGQWVTVSDKTGEHESMVELRLAENGLLEGQVMKVFREDAKGETCQDCPQPFTDQLIEGMTFLWGLSNDDKGQWSGGEVIDPEDGSIYQMKIETIDGGAKIEVRGFIGFSLFGRTQTWLRYQPEVVTVPESQPESLTVTGSEQ